MKLVLSGTGAPFAVFVGALKALEAAGKIKLGDPSSKLFPEAVAGCSGGAAVGAFVAAGMDLTTLVAAVKGINPSKLLDPNILPLLERIASVFAPKKKRPARGLFAGDKILAELRRRLPALLGMVRCPLYIVTTDMSAAPRGAVVWASEVGPAELPIRVAPGQSLPTLVRASMSMYPVFDPVVVEGHTHIDGGYANNFPIDLFGDGDDVIGLRFIPAAGTGKPVEGELELTAASIDMLIEAASQKHLEDAMHARVIYIRPSKGTFDFDMGPEAVDALMADGEKAVERWLARGGKTR